MPNRSTLRFTALVPVALTACTSLNPAPADVARVCDQAPLARFVGREASQRTGAEILAASHARVIRWATIGMMLTMEYRTDRVTVRIDKANRVLAANCG